MIRQFRKLIVKTTEYLNDTSVNMNDRAFVVFSTTVLVALFAAIPCGLIMHEPLSATLSTLAGAVFFTAYVAWAIIKDRLEVTVIQYRSSRSGRNSSRDPEHSSIPILQG